jgi:hypothetical protein
VVAELFAERYCRPREAVAAPAGVDDRLRGNLREVARIVFQPVRAVDAAIDRERNLTLVVLAWRCLVDW